MARVATKPFTPAHHTRTYDVPGHCPGCGTKNSMFGFSLLQPDGRFAHSHIVCSAWIKPEVPIREQDIPMDGGHPCGWHGWSVPGWRDSADELDEHEVDLIGDAVILDLWDRYSDDLVNIYDLIGRMKDLGFDITRILTKLWKMDNDGLIDIGDDENVKLGERQGD